MHKSISDIFTFCINFNTLLSKKNNNKKIKEVDVGIAPSFVGIIPFASKINPIISVGAQNVSDQELGARTSQVSVSMLKDLRVGFCLVGHSEVRSYLHESNELINKKIKLLIANHVAPVLCVGETLNEFEKHLTESVVKTQLDECLKGVGSKKLGGLVVAYEPIWAIGTGKTATNAIIRDSMLMIKQHLQKRFATKAKTIKILYGGSVNEINANDILKIEGVDGVLVGGASLDPQKFWTIISSTSH